MVLFITRQQNDVIRLIDSVGATEAVAGKQQVIADAQAQVTKNKERIAALQQLGKS